MDRLPNLTRDKILITTPSWESVNEDLRWFFLLHTYAFACFFFVLSFYTFFSVLNLRSLISRPPFMSTINIFLCLLGASRSGCLFIDSYNLKAVMPKVVGSVMWDTGFPFITSAFCLIQLAFLQITQMKFGLEKFQKETYLNLMIIFHFLCIIISDVTLAFRISYVAKYVVQTFFLIWSIILYVAFLYVGYKVKLLLKTISLNLLAPDNFIANQKGILQLAVLAPYNNLATSVAAALVPTLLGPNLKALENNKENKGSDMNHNLKSTHLISSIKSSRVLHKSEIKKKQSTISQADDLYVHGISTVPEVYIRPSTPTPSTVNIPIITMSSPSRRSSLASRRGGDASRISRHLSEYSVRFVNENDLSFDPEATSVCRLSADPDTSSQYLQSLKSPHSLESTIRYNSNCIVAPTASKKDVRHCYDFTYEKNRSQFPTKLRRNSDFGNRIPKRIQQEAEQFKLSKILDVSPTVSRCNSDLAGLASARMVESRRNSDILCHEPYSNDINVCIRDRYSRQQNQGNLAYNKSEVQQSESKFNLNHDFSDGDYEGETATPMNKNDKQIHENSDTARKKNISWKIKDVRENITAETKLLSDSQQPSTVMATDFNLHSILNHISYVNRAKSNIHLHITETSTTITRMAQIKRVLNVIYSTAIFGIILCIADVVRIFGPYGLLANVAKYGTDPTDVHFPKAWPWIIYQTVCRFLELIMGCAMASITKQPSISPHHQCLSNYPNYNLRMKQRERDNLHI